MPKGNERSLKTGLRSAPEKLAALVIATIIGQAFAQQVITTVAGTDFVYPRQPLPGPAAPLGTITGLALDSAGNLYLSDPSNSVVLKMNAQGILSVYAGNGTVGFSGDGEMATSAALNLNFVGGFRDGFTSGKISDNYEYLSGGLATDSSGNLFIADTGNHRVRKIAPSGVITTIAGSGKRGFAGDGGQAALASLNNPASVAVDSAGNVYITDTDNNRVRKVSPEGIITTVAGNGVSGNASQNGPATLSPLSAPAAITVDNFGNLYIGLGLTNNSASPIVVKVNGANMLSALPSPSCQGVTDSLAADSSGSLFISEAVNSASPIFGNDCNLVYKIRPDGVILKVAGTERASGFSGDGGPATGALLNVPQGIVVDSAGNLFVADSRNLRLRKITPTGIISTVAGNGGYNYGGDGGPAISANLSYPQGLAVDTTGGIFVADTDNNRIRHVTPDGIISTFAGTGDFLFSDDGGPAIAAPLLGPTKVAVDSVGDVFIADTGSYRVRIVNPAGIINTAVTYPSSVKVYGVAVDAAGDVFSGGVQGIFKTNSGTSSVVSTSFDAYDIASDAAGNVLITDPTVLANNVHSVTASGVSSIIAGKGGDPGYSGDGGQATIALLNQPRGVAMDPAGNVYIADSINHRIRNVAPNGVISTFAGTGVGDFSGDGGPSTKAALNIPSGVAVDTVGNIYIADAGNNRIRKILASPPAVQVSTASLSFNGLSTGAPAPTQRFSITSVPGLAFSLAVSTARGGNWLTVSPQSGAAPRLIDVTADPSQLSSPGVYSGAITLSTPNGSPATTTVNVTFVVSGAQVPNLAPLEPRNFTFSFAKSTPAQSQSLTISNSGGGTLNFSATANLVTPSGASPLTLSQTTGKATPGSPAILTLTADPTSLGPGTFTGTVSVSAGNTTVSVPVTITVSALDQAIQLSQRGLSFTAVEQGGVIPAQTFAVRNIGAGVVAWTAKTVPPAPINGIVSTVPWLSVSPASGTTDAAQSPPTVTVSVDVSKLIEGVYYGLVEVDAPTAANSPQLMTVTVQVMKAGFNAGAVLAPGSLLFTAVSGQSSPGSQNVAVYNVAAKAKSFRSAVSTDPGLKIVTLPTDATLDPRNPTSMVVQPFTDGLAPGVYNGVVTLQFDDGRVLRFMIKVIVTATGGASSGLSSRSHSRDASRADVLCTPKTMQPILVAPNDSFQGLTGTGIKIGVFVKDNCGVPLEAGSVTVTFSNGDSRANLTSLRGGLWEGNWYTRNPSPSVNLTLTATNPAGISGTATTNGSVAMQQPPVFDNTGIVSAFGGPSFVPLAPGGVIFVNGSALAETSQAASGVPLLPTLVDTQVTIGLQPMPLYAVSDQQVKAVVPYSLTQSLNAPLQIVVQRGTTLSQPVDVTVATAEPVIYSGDKAVTSAPADGGMPYIVTQDNPAHIGDTITIYCVGLGAVDPPVADGGLPSGISSPAPVQMLIGEQAATVTFQGLTPQLPGIYKVSGVVPASASTGSSVPVTINVGGQTSPPILIPIQ
jgi:uncharacterized protein (TIGR03437 family)